jgi:hypothetical protein
MNTSLTSKFLAAVGVCLGFAQAAAAQDSIAAEPVSVWIFSDRYIASEHAIPNPAPQDARVQPARPQTIRLDLCERFAPRLLLTAYLFRDFHLEIRPLTAEHSSCTVETTAYAVIVGSSTQKLSPNEDAFVDRYWRELMP